MEAMPTSQHQTPSATDTPSFVLYRDIHRLPLSVFIDAAVDEDLTVLCVKGEAPLESLQAKWRELIEQYADAIGAGLGEGVKRALLVEIKRLEVRVNACQRLLVVLQDYYIQEFAESVCKMLRVQYAFDQNDNEAYDKDIQRAWSDTKSLDLKLTLKRDVWEAMEEENKEGKVSRDYFMRILLNLADWKTRDIRDDITTAAFCHLVKQYGEYVSRQNAKK